MLKQDLYPAAPNGPVTFTLAGQEVLGGHSGGGWYQAPPSFAEVLRQIGVPVSTAGSAAPLHQPTPVSDLSSSADTTPAGTLWALIASLAAAVVVLAVAAALIRRRRAVGV